MPKINVYLPDDLAEAVKESGIPVSAICQRALEQAVRRVTAIRETALADLAPEDLAARLPNVSPRARTVLQLAFRRALAEHAPGIGTGHILAGIIEEGSNLALQVLQVMEIQQSTIPLTGDLSDGATAEGRFSVPAASALELAVTEAVGFGHNYVGCEHLLLGLINEPDGTGGQILRSLGAEPRPTRRAVSAALAGYVHLKAQSSPPDIAAVVRAELRPIIERLERLEAAGEQ